MNFYAFNIGDYAGATRHLSWDEDMAYRRMLDAYYSREAPLPLERRQIYRLVGASEQRQREAVDVVLEEFFEQRSDGWHNSHIEHAIAAQKKLLVRSREWEARLDVTFGEWRALRALIFEVYGCSCAYCGKAAVAVDHLVPISMGGTSIPDNLLPACKSCNSSKGNKPYREWRRSGGIQ